MDQHHQRYSLTDKEHSVVNYVTTILKDTLLVQQEILAQLTLLNTRVVTIEHRLEDCIRDARNYQYKASTVPS
jgi:hypothetical protein